MFTRYRQSPLDNAGTGRAFGADYGPKDEAEAAGRDAAQADKVEHVIKYQNGKIAPRTATAMIPGMSRADPAVHGIAQRCR
ncbi:DUF2188 domain-containing protein [Arthrobacter sp. I2-34]|uniref:DUF2188 domain-containing protein n=1 Tax=Arthrobacter hankyongi TaxID=2904801 RepID=A0ABS9L4N4_9MICC|nr:DUF2188 domain-containing protein [Arthrobacter hankyongi]MCG2621640.1 DUF2188 domain-containing protein [Arthrobacter hankyongi]